MGERKVSIAMTLQLLVKNQKPLAFEIAIHKLY
jgi:hypothetical protein